MDFLKRAKARLDFECDMMALSAVIGAPRAYRVTHENRTALTMFPEGMARRSSPPERREQLLVDKPTSDDSRCERSWLVRATENITVPPRSHQIATGKLDVEKGQTPPRVVCVEPAQIPIHGILPARVLSRVGTGCSKDPSRNPPKPMYRCRVIARW
jgi:hypothetical protein